MEKRRKTFAKADIENPYKNAPKLLIDMAYSTLSNVELKNETNEKMFFQS